MGSSKYVFRARKASPCHIGMDWIRPGQRCAIDFETQTTVHLRCLNWERRQRAFQQKLNPQRSLAVSTTADN